MERNRDDSPEIDTAIVAGLATRAGELSSLVEDLISTVKLNRLARAYITIVTLVLVAVGGLNLWNTFETKHTTTLIVSCIDPNGSCYKDGRKSTAQSVKSINETIVAAIACSKQPENKTTDDIRACVIKTLAHD